MTVFIPVNHGVVKMDLEDRLKFPGKISSYHGMRKINIVIYHEGRSHHLHRLILGVNRKDRIGDHIFGDRFDVRKKNLRVVTVKTNNKNKSDYKKRSGLPRGVSLRSGRYVAIITINKKATYLGSFDSPELAHETFVAAHKKAHGKNSVYNVRDL